MDLISTTIKTKIISSFEQVKCVSSNKLSIRHESKWDTSLNVKDFTKNFNFPHNTQMSKNLGEFCRGEC
jgi:hypothetical protein